MEDDGHQGNIAYAKVGEVLMRVGGGRAVYEFGPATVLQEAVVDGVRRLRSSCKAAMVFTSSCCGEL